MISTRRPRRTIAVAVLAVALVGGLAGCSATNPIQTQRPYSPADGVRATLGPLETTNLLVAGTAKGHAAALSGGLVNTGADALTVSVAVSGETSTFTVPGHGSVLIGTGSDSGRTMPIQSLDADPGALTTVTLKVPSAGSAAVQVPVVDGALPQYTSVLPSPSSGSGATASSSATASATPGAKAPTPKPSTSS
ncbi:MAG: hypothetical protein B7X40_01470 [Cellulomonas sp. 14-74-6]|nr:MAG: hypothetical protein B7X40_01470 [Cellulomonas sp. 14-74-6]